MDKINFDVSRKLMQLYELLIIVELEKAVTRNLASREWSENYDRDTVLKSLKHCSQSVTQTTHFHFIIYPKNTTYMNIYLQKTHMHHVKVKIPAE